MIAIVDSSVLYASLDADDAGHAASAAVMQRPEFDLIIPSLVIAEVTYFVGKKLGARVEAAFLRGLAELEVETATRDEWAAIADLLERYRDLPLGATDAFVAVLADRFDTHLILTLDRRHFGALRARDGAPFTLLPA